MSHIEIVYEDLKKVNQPYFSDFSEKLNEVMKGGWYILGENVHEFESQFSKIHNNLYTVGLASGLDALVLAIEAFSFPPNSIILVPSNTYIATILAIIKTGHQPVLVEPDPLTYNIDIINIEKVYSKKCVAILVVHLYGRLCEMQEIISFAKIKNLIIIEDCAQSHFAEINKNKAGTFGDIAAFSFYPTKNLGALGDAGAIVCKDENIYKKIIALRNYGSHIKYHNKYIGYNSRLDEIQAAFLNIKLRDFNSVLLHKQNLAQLYLDNLSENHNIQLPLTAGTNNVWHIFNILIKDRNRIKSELFTRGIGTEIHYPIPPHQQEGYSGYFEEHYPISEKIHNNTLSLPISVAHNKNDIYRVIEVLNDILK